MWLGLCLTALPPIVLLTHVFIEEANFPPPPLLMLLPFTQGVIHNKCHLFRSEPSTFLLLWQCVCYCHRRCGLHPTVLFKKGECWVSQREGSTHISLAGTTGEVWVCRAMLNQKKTLRGPSRMVSTFRSVCEETVNETWQWCQHIPAVISHQLWFDL